MVKGKKSLSELALRKRDRLNKTQLNPFEIHINKDKLKVLGKKSKADRGLPGISRAKAINKRKGTLLREYKQIDKDNVFLDKRIGEKNVSMSLEDKAMARFAAERMRVHRKNNIYSLNDEEVLTHRGQTLEEIEKFDDPKSDDEFSDNENLSGKLDDKFVGEAHFGGGVLSKTSSMSRKDLIEQLILESKKRKAEKQKIREQTIDLTEKLDSEWRDLLPVVTASKVSDDDPVEKPKVDDYDIAVRELKFQARGTPSERLKSEEEIIKEEKEKLEALEADRKARMKGFIQDTHGGIRHKSADDLDDGFVVETIESADVNKENQLEEGIEDNSEDEGSNDNSANEHEKNYDTDTSITESKSTNKENSTDSLTESSRNKETRVKAKTRVEETVSSKHKENSEGSISGEETNENSDSGDSDDFETDNLSDLKESDSVSEDDTSPCEKSVKFTCNPVQSVPTATNLHNTEPKSILKATGRVRAQNSSGDNKNREQEIRDDLLKRKEIMEKARKELPYTYAAPESMDELKKLLGGHDPEYQAVIIDRIIKCNHWSLDKNNKDKLANLFIYLLQHIVDSLSVAASTTEGIVKYFEIVDRVCPYLYDLAHGNPQSTKTSMQEVIKRKHEEFERHIKNYPDVDTLILFKLVSLLFPTSDFRHAVVTPCLVFMSQILMRCRVRTRQDISKGLFICTLLLEYTALSKRFAPSVINFLRGVIYIATPKHLLHRTKIIPPFKTVGETSNLLVVDEEQTELEIDPCSPLMNANDLANDYIDNQFKVRALLTAINLANEFKNHLTELEAVYSIFEPIYKLLKVNRFEKYPTSVRKHIKVIRKEMGRLQERKLEYMIMEKKKPKPLRLYEPRIEKVYDGKKHKSMSKEKAEREKLLHKYKKAMKGAMREIRKDRAFLAKVQIREQLKSDAERKRKVKEIFGEAAVQQSEFNKMKRKK